MVVRGMNMPRVNHMVLVRPSLFHGSTGGL